MGRAQDAKPTHGRETPPAYSRTTPCPPSLTEIAAPARQLLQHRSRRSEGRHRRLPREAGQETTRSHRPALVRPGGRRVAAAPAPGSPGTGRERSARPSSRRRRIAGACPRRSAPCARGGAHARPSCRTPVRSPRRSAGGDQPRGPGAPPRAWPAGRAAPRRAVVAAARSRSEVGGWVGCVGCMGGGRVDCRGGQPVTSRRSIGCVCRVTSNYGQVKISVLIRGQLFSWLFGQRGCRGRQISAAFSTTQFLRAEISAVACWTTCS